MAIQINLETSQFGVSFQGAYFRIVNATITRTRDANNRFSVMIDVVGYATQPTNDDTREVDFRRYHAPLPEIEAHTGSEFMAKCYSWVTTQPNMADAISV